MGNAVLLNSGGGSVFSDDLTATAEFVLSNKTYMGLDSDDDEKAGTMPIIAPRTYTIASGGSQTIPRGYHDGTGVVAAKTVAEQTQGTSTAGKILESKTAWVAGQQLTGTMPNNGAQNNTINCGASRAILAGYHNGSGRISVNSLASQTSGNAGATQILATKTAWVNGDKITGAMPNQGAKTYTLNCGGSRTIPAGYHNGSGTVTANDLASQTSATALNSTIRAGYTAWVNGQKITGNIQDVAGGTYTPGTSNVTVAPSGKYLTSAITVVGSSNLVASNIRKGYTLFGVAGSYVASPITLVEPTGRYEDVSTCFFNGFGEWVVAYRGANITNAFTGSETYGNYKHPQVAAIGQSSAGPANYAFFRSSSAIKLTNYNKLHYQLSSDELYNDEIFVFGISASSKLTTNSFTRSVTFDADDTGGTGYLDISAVSGSYYIYLLLNPRQGSLYVQTANIYLST